MTDHLQAISYPDAFLTARPKDGYDVVQDHLKATRTLDEELSQYFKERAHIEDQYAQSLVKASKKFFVMDKTSLGKFAPTWELLYNELTEISTAHAVLAMKITEEIEKPLRSPASSDFDRIKQMDPAVHRIVKDYDDTAKKGKKSGDKAGTLLKRLKDGKSKGSSDAALARWVQEGPTYLEHHQRLEEARLHRLKDLVEKFEQVQTDQMLKRMEICNATLMSANEFEPQAEMLDFCEAHGKGLRKLSDNQPRRPSADSAMRPQQQQSSSTLSSDARDAQSVHSTSQEPPKPSSKTKSPLRSFSLRRKTRNGSATRLPDTAIATIDESVETPNSPSYSQSATHLPASANGPSQPQVAAAAATSSPDLTANSMPNLQTNLQASQAPAVDSEGFSIPPANRQSFMPMADAAGGSQSLDEFDTESLQAAQRIKFDIRDSAVKTDEDKEADATMTRMATLLRAKTPSVSRRPRGRREMRNSMQVEPASQISPIHVARPGATEDAPPTVSSGSASPANPFQTSTPTSVSSNAVSRSPSLSSAVLFSSGSTPGSPGSEAAQLYASIVETVETDGQGCKLQGQVKLVYNGPTTQGPLLFKLSGNVDLVPDLTYVEPWGDAENALYSLKAAAFPRRTPILCFTYQVDNVPRPVQMTPAWKCIEGTTFLILKYKQTLDRQKSQVATCVKVQDEPTVTGVQSTPQGGWDPSKCQLTWSTLEEEQGRLLAKFIVEGIGEPGLVALKFYSKDTLLSGVSFEAVPAHGSILELKQVQMVTRSGKYIV
ncbi:hypothetical protein BCR43DRAFT_527035 [Syncephalastrum racemosum]|uniref:FCH domain-containing protein n=1 Tax=Syncephalastrum racemosum TaxID=13706 RepID=A0A1X2H539_SYNRA|nr:hypothetical protein BCR43DRAFT_527035 [Syncephalastrum racemosum]